MVRRIPSRPALQGQCHESPSPYIPNPRDERSEQARAACLKLALWGSEDRPPVPEVCKAEVTHRHDAGTLHPEAPLAETDPWVGHDAYYPVYRSLHEAGLPLQGVRLRKPFRKIGALTMVVRKLNYALAKTIQGVLQ